MPVICYKNIMNFPERKNITFETVMSITHNNAAEQFRLQLRSPWKFRLFLLRRMPIALIAGLFVRQLDGNTCTVSIPYKWLSKNPFRSVYFATQAMAAEMSTGIHAMAAIQGYQPSISMLVTKLEGTFHKKAAERIYFTCSDGDAMYALVAQAVANQESVVFEATSKGHLQDGTHVSTFTINWSFKQKST
jgi:hypothetical protein